MGTNLVTTGLELSAPSPYLQREERGWRLNQLQMANDLLNDAGVMKPS